MINQDPTSREVASQAGERLTRSAAEPELPPRFLKAEANLLRLPLFALHTKGLRTLDGLECRGTTTRGGQTQEFIFRITRNTNSLYPGPLSRKVHFALIDIASERNMPLANPITWTWRDLCRRMHIAYSGSNTIRKLKTAIRSTHGIVISSHYALYARTDGQVLPLAESETGEHFYAKCMFLNERLPEGGTADSNAVWFADWYLANLNAFFTAPLDYQLWIKLEKKSPIASRLYEFLLINFYSGTPVLRINYPKLAQFLPIHAHRYTSDAERQLAPAFKLLTQAEAIAKVTWTTSRQGVPQLHLHRGNRLRAPGDRRQTPLGFMEEEFSGNLEVKEVRNIKPTDWEMITNFYRQWAKLENYHPTKKELEFARSLIDQHGQAKAKGLIPLAINQLEKRWPDAKSFLAISKYLPEAEVEYDRRQRESRRQREEKIRAEQEREREAKARVEEQAFMNQWLPIWESLAEAEREAIRATVKEKNPYLNHPVLGRSSFATVLCLQELANRSEASQNHVADGPQTA